MVSHLRHDPVGLMRDTKKITKILQNVTRFDEVMYKMMYCWSLFLGMLVISLANSKIEQNDFIIEGMLSSLPWRWLFVQWLGNCKPELCMGLSIVKIYVGIQELQLRQRETHTRRQTDATEHSTTPLLITAELKLEWDRAWHLWWCGAGGSRKLFSEACLQLGFAYERNNEPETALLVCTSF